MTQTLNELWEKREEYLTEYLGCPRSEFGNAENNYLRTGRVQAIDLMVKEYSRLIGEHSDKQDFEAVLREVFCVDESDSVTAIIMDDNFARKVYAALCNVIWTHEKGDRYTCSWRYAGELVADLRTKGEDYLDFYCSGNEGYVDREVAEALAEQGWTYRVR